MNSHDLVLLLLGSFLPNNLFIWLWARLRGKFRRLEKHKLRLIHPIKYYAQFESDPKTQYKYHRKMAVFWILNLIPISVLLVLSILASFGKFTTNQALLVTAITLSLNTFYSLYANFDTETGDAHAAYASIKTEEIQATQNQVALQPQVEEALPEWSLS